MATPIEATPSVAQEESNRAVTDQRQQQNQDPNPFDMRICITGGVGDLLLGAAASARMAGALAPKATIKKTPKADIF
jgi:hypothetical protein